MLGPGDRVPDVPVWTAPREESRPLREVLGAGLSFLCFYLWDWHGSVAVGYVDSAVVAGVFWRASPEGLDDLTLYGGSVPTEQSGIEWTESTWNPVTGCSKVSPGCARCYAEALSRRFGWTAGPWTPTNAIDNVVLHPERLDQPLRWRQPRMVFVNSMSDLFHELVPLDFIGDVFKVMTEADHHVFQILTKRHERLAEVARLIQWPENVWMGVSIENNRWALRADYLREVPAEVRFISAEPLLGPLDELELEGIDWLIAGGESGHGHRPMQEAWVLQLRDRCLQAGIPFFFKQWGGRTSKAGGRELAGREWNEMPRVTDLALV